MKRKLWVILSAFLFVTCFWMLPRAQADSDGDGLLDLIDVAAFDPARSYYGGLGIEDLDGATALESGAGHSLSFRSNRITSIENGDFAGLTGMSALDLSRNLIGHIQNGGFAGPTDLNSIDLRRNKIDALRGAIFEGVTPSLEVLYLDENEITNLDSDAVSGISNVRSLYLNRNGLKRLEGGAFEGLTNLQRLELAYNQVSTIERGDMEGLSRLRWLDMTDNGIADLLSGGLTGLASLQELEFFGNEIGAIEKGDFDGLGNLQTLGLHGNAITNLGSEGFVGLTNLETLHLAGNAITSLGDGEFDGLTNLRTLGLSSNLITDLGGGSFAGLTNLQSLHLRRNRIRNLERYNFAGLSQLQELDLEGNEITSLDLGDFEGLDNSLQAIRLADNNIDSIESGVFAGFENLIGLDLSGNDKLFELNLTGATFEKLGRCSITSGFCVDSRVVTSLVLDDAILTPQVFATIVRETDHLTEASLVGLTLLEEGPETTWAELAIDRLLGGQAIEAVTVDRRLFDAHSDAFNSFAATVGKTLAVVNSSPCDFDLDGRCNVDDIDLLMRLGAVDVGVPVSGGETDIFDLDGSRVIDGDDIAEWRRLAADENGFSESYQLGDANLDGTIDSEDLNVVGLAWQTSGNVWSSGDFDGDGLVDGRDLNSIGIGWRSSLAERTAAASVPESVPCGVLLWIALLAGSRSRTLRSRPYTGIHSCVRRG